MDIEELIDQIGVSRREFERKVREIKEHFAGLLSEETAIMLAAYSFGYVQESSISEIGGKRGIVSIEGIVERVELKNLQREFLAILTVSDDTGALKVAMWGEAAQLVRLGEVGAGDSVKLRGLVRERNGITELLVRNAKDITVVRRGGESLKGTIVAMVKRNEGVVAALATESEVKICTATGTKAEEVVKLKKGDSIEVFGYPMAGEFVISSVSPAVCSFKPDFTPIASLRSLQPANIRGRVSGIGEVRRVKNRLLAEIYISDDSGRVKVILWDDNVSAYRKADVADIVEIFNCFPKIGWDGEIEVHCGKRSVVSIEKS